jgi:hypothetical protein
MFLRTLNQSELGSLLCLAHLTFVSGAQFVILHFHVLMVSYILGDSLLPTYKATSAHSPARLKGKGPDLQFFAASLCRK